MPGLDHVPELSPDGKVCRTHEGRPAFCVCPRCRGHVCGLCWFAEHGRCHRCIVTAPEEIAPPLPWERDEGRPLARFTATLRTALSPAGTAAAFATGTTRRAFVFFVLSFVPLALARGIIPYTHLVHFGPTFAVRLADGADPSRVALDVASAAGLGLLESLVVVLALLACYRSLSGAFGKEGAAAIATRLVLYRAFLVPLGAFIPLSVAGRHQLLPDGLLLSLGGFMIPERWELVILVILVSAVPPVLVFVSMRAVARLVLGTEPVPAFLLAFLPWVLSVLAFALVHHALAPFIPSITFL